jgi:alkylation response protein AidB-like acyl-CoA dehydrogenase
MKFLAAERQTLEAFLPGLDEKLSGMGLLQCEEPDSGAIALFKSMGGPGLLIPRKYTGLGADAVQALHIQRAIGSRAPSLAVATTMHHFSVATLIAMCSTSQGLEWLLLQAIAQQRLLLASGFAEGVSGRGILRPAMQAKKVPQGVLVSGSKKPCSLSRSMDLLTASVTVTEGPESLGRFGIVLISATSPGIERRPFWNSLVLGGAESDELVLRDVFVPDRLIFYASEDIKADANEGAGFLWFLMLVSASYLGVASALAERVVESGKGTTYDRSRLGAELEGAMAGLESVAHSIMAAAPVRESIARALFVRYAVQSAIERATALAAEAMGGMAFVASSEIGYLYAAARVLSLHPPSRVAASLGLANYLAGGDLRLD